MADPIVVASNRGPVTFDVGADGARHQRRGTGGLVTAVSGALRNREGLWIASAISEGDRAVAAEHSAVTAELGETHLSVRLIDMPPQIYADYYDGFCNRILWFVHHYLWDPPRTPRFTERDDEAFRAYEQTNQRFAEVAAETAPKHGVAIIQDYHFALVPRMLRSLRPDLSIGLFWHIPFAQPDYFGLLTDDWAQALIDGLCGADVIGFQAARWADNFLACARATGIKARGRVLRADGRKVHAGVFPIGVDPNDLASTASEPATRAAREELERWLGGRRLVLRVDRAELSKNILRGLRAYELFLHRNPELRAGVVHLALLQPSRQGVPEYRDYTDACVAEAQRINDRFGPDSVRLELSDDYPRSIAAYSIYDVLVVNPVFDGMNLVAREGPCVNGRDGVLVLSRNAGAAAELAPAALVVNPVDVERTARAIGDALAMPARERRSKARRLRRLAAGRPPAAWLDAQLQRLATIR